MLMLAATGISAYTAAQMDFEHPALRGKPILPGTELEPTVSDSLHSQEATDEGLVHELLAETTESLQLDADFEELAETLGHRYDLSINYPLTSNTLSHYYRGEPRTHIPGPMRLGSRIIDIAQERPFAGSNVVGVRGKALLYRTRQAEDSTETLAPRDHDAPELYHEAGFFCLALARRDHETGKIIPGVSYGDFDRTQWGSQAAKIGVIKLLSGDKFTEMLRTNVDVSDRYEALEHNLFGVEKRLWKRQPRYGIFLQNGDVFVNDFLGSHILKEQIRGAMQAFIDEQAVPEQIFNGEGDVFWQPKPQLLQAHFMPVGVNEPGLFLPWSDCQIQEDHLDLPLVKAVLQATSSYDRIYSSLRLHGLDKPLQELLRDVPHDQLFDAFNRTTLTDDEIRLVHSCFEQTIGGTEKIMLSLAWEHALKEYPHLYPDITKEQILTEAQKELQLRFKVPKELPA